MFFQKKKQLPKKLNICFITKRFDSSIQKTRHGFLIPIIKGLTKMGHSVTVLSWKGTHGQTKIVEDGFTIYFLGEKNNISSFGQSIYFKFQELHKKNPFHILHSFEPEGIHIAREKKKHEVITAFDASTTEMFQLFSIAGRARDTFISQIQTALNLFYKFMTTYYSKDIYILKHSDFVFVTSPRQKDVLERYYLYPDSRTYVVPYMMEIDISEKTQNETLREKLGIPANCQVVAMSTDMINQEEIFNVLIAFQKVAIKKKNVRLLILGTGPLQNIVEKKVLNLALGSKIIFAKNIAPGDIDDYISLCKVFVDLNIRSTGFSVALVEAMAQKKVVIGSELSPMTTIIRDQEDGFLIRPADQASLTSLILKTFNEQIDSDIVGKKAFAKVKNLFLPEKMVKETLYGYYRAISLSPIYENMVDIESFLD